VGALIDLQAPPERPDHPILRRPETLLPAPAGVAAVVTGSAGFLGTRVLRHLNAPEDGLGVAFDLPESVLDIAVLRRLCEPGDWCLHLAADKYATSAEDRPGQVADLNVRGTQNVVDAFGPNVVLASTCKAADPMTVYGASKLIAERIVLNAGGRVVRLVNVLGSTGSVVEQWNRLPLAKSLPVTSCKRYWMTPDEASRLLVAATGWPSGRYTLAAPLSGGPTAVMSVATRLFPGRRLRSIPLRRGDRPVERVVAEYESLEPFADGVLRIRHPFD
jgi:FlaA1/EpsC-like NDP-sugar epimerase